MMAEPGEEGPPVEASVKESQFTKVSITESRLPVGWRIAAMLVYLVLVPTRIDDLFELILAGAILQAILLGTVLIALSGLLVFILLIRQKKSAQ